MTVSVIIPARTVTIELKEALPHLLALNPAAHEIIVVLDQQPPDKLPVGIKLLIQAGGPAVKRDVAANTARGDILAFLDDDAYPKPDWLAKALPHFNDPAVAAVGGPAVTPANDGWQAQLSGAVLTSPLGTGPAQMRYWPTGQVRTMDDWPSVNLLVRKQAFDQIGGFDTNYWPGEDTKLCLDLVRAGYKLVYDPAVVCYHHRATTMNNHFKQVSRYALHRGHFVRQFPLTSRRLSYFLPSAAVAIFFISALSAVSLPASRQLIGLSLLVAALIVIISGLIEAKRVHHWYIAVLYPLWLPLTHLVYGLMFIRGLLSSRLKQYHRSTR